MAWNFADSFDLYATTADMVNNYWDSMPSPPTFVAGRFAGSQAIQLNWNNNASLVKASNVNDAVHHIVISFKQTGTYPGGSNNIAFCLWDGNVAGAQCTIQFMGDGTIKLLQGNAGSSTVLDTYTGGWSAANTWYAFEFEVVINNTTGSWAIRKNGNSVNDHALGGLNTRGGSTNNYANTLVLTMTTNGQSQVIDDLFWQSGAAAGTWLGDIRCFTRMPSSDQSVQFSRTPATTFVQTVAAVVNNTAVVAGRGQYAPFTATFSGAISTATVSMLAGYTGNMKCALFASSGGTPTTVLGSATPIVNPTTGSNTFTFGTPVSVTAGTQYWIGFDSDTSSGTWNNAGGAAGGFSTTTYASFPAASPSLTAAASTSSTVTITLGGNFAVVNEPQQDGLTSYVYDSNPGDADFYGIAGIGVTPARVVATVVRGYMQKDQSGTRTAAAQLKSGATTVATPTLILTTSGWQWAWRMDLTDPNTGAAWTAAAVNGAQIGPKVIA